MSQGGQTNAQVIVTTHLDMGNGRREVRVESRDACLTDLWTFFVPAAVRPTHPLNLSLSPAFLFLPSFSLQREQQQTRVVDASTHPRFNHELAFRVPSLTGIVHVAVFHVDAKHFDFIGEGCATLDTFEHAQDIKLNYEQPLTQQLSRRAYTLLGVLAARRTDEGVLAEGGSC